VYWLAVKGIGHDCINLGLRLHLNEKKPYCPLMLRDLKYSSQNSYVLRIAKNLAYTRVLAGQNMLRMNTFLIYPCHLVHLPLDWQYVLFVTPLPSTPLFEDAHHAKCHLNHRRFLFCKLSPSDLFLAPVASSTYPW